MLESHLPILIVLPLFFGAAVVPAVAPVAYLVLSRSLGPLVTLALTPAVAGNELVADIERKREDPDDPEESERSPGEIQLSRNRHRSTTRKLLKNLNPVLHLQASMLLLKIMESI